MKKIMIVDDDVTSVAIVKALLEPEFEVVSANTGVEALGELQRSPDLNLILLDMVMPGVSGMDLLKVLKKSENWSNISVIFLTSLEGVDIELEGFTNGASDFLQKPVNAELLAEDQAPAVYPGSESGEPALTKDLADAAQPDRPGIQRGPAVSLPLTLSCGFSGR